MSSSRMVPSTPVGAESGVVDESVEGPEIGAQRAYERPDMLDVGQVAAAKFDRSAAGLERGAARVLELFARRCGRRR